jgi:hypothetical protein
MLDIVFSERLRLSQRVDSAPFPALVSQGIGSDSAIVQVNHFLPIHERPVPTTSEPFLMQDLTLIDLAATAEEGTAAAAAARKALVWTDESGRLGWTPVGGFLLAEIRDATLQLAAALPGAPSGEE